MKVYTFGDGVTKVYDCSIFVVAKNDTTLNGTYHFTGNVVVLEGADNAVLGNITADGDIFLLGKNIHANELSAGGDVYIGSSNYVWKVDASNVTVDTGSLVHSIEADNNTIKFSS